MGLFKTLLIILLLLALIILYGYHDWQAGEVVFSEKVDKFANPLFKGYERFVKPWFETTPAIEEFTAGNGSASTIITYGDESYEGILNEVTE